MKWPFPRQSSVSRDAVALVSVTAFMNAAKRRCSRRSPTERPQFRILDRQPFLLRGGHCASAPSSGPLLGSPVAAIMPTVFACVDIAREHRCECDVADPSPSPKTRSRPSPRGRCRARTASIANRPLKSIPNASVPHSRRSALSFNSLRLQHPAKAEHLDPEWNGLSSSRPAPFRPTRVDRDRETPPLVFLYGRRRTS